MSFCENVFFLNWLFPEIGEQNSKMMMLCNSVIHFFYKNIADDTH